MKKKIVGTVGVIFLVVMVGLTVWSRGIYQNSLPLVRLDLPRTGVLSFHYTAYGKVRATENGLWTDVLIPSEEITADFPFYRGDTVELTFPNEINSKTQGYIEAIDNAEEGIHVEVSFSRSSVQDGDSVTVELHKRSQEMENVLPSTAVHLDDSPYLWLVQEQQGPWGTEYIAVKKYIVLLADDGEKAAIAVAVDKPVVVASSEPLTEGQPIRFYP